MLFFYIVHQNLSRLPANNPNDRREVASPRLKTTDLANLDCLPCCFETEEQS